MKRLDEVNDGSFDIDDGKLKELKTQGTGTSAGPKFKNVL